MHSSQVPLGIKVISMDDQFLVGSYGQWQVPIPPPTPSA